MGRQPAHEVRNFYASADVLIVPSIPTRTFREPWGLVVNEAMNQGLPVIASDAVGAAAGGLVRDERNGLIVPAGNAEALTASILRLQGDAGSRAGMGAAARRDVAEFTFEAWAEGFSRRAGQCLGLQEGGGVLIPLRASRCLSSHHGRSRDDRPAGGRRKG